MNSVSGRLFAAAARRAPGLGLNSRVFLSRYSLELMTQGTCAHAHKAGRRVTVTWGIGQGGFYKLFMHLNFSSELNVILIFYRKVSLGRKCFLALGGGFHSGDGVLMALSLHLSCVSFLLPLYQDPLLGPGVTCDMTVKPTPR